MRTQWEHELLRSVNEFQLHKPTIKMTSDNLKKVDKFVAELNAEIKDRVNKWYADRNAKVDPWELKASLVKYKTYDMENVPGFLTIAEDNFATGAIYCYIDKSTLEVYGIKNNQATGKKLGDLDQNIDGVAKKVHDNHQEHLRSVYNKTNESLDESSDAIKDTIKDLLFQAIRNNAGKPRNRYIDTVKISGDTITVTDSHDVEHKFTLKEDK